MSTQTLPNTPLVTVDEAAAFLGLSRSTAHRCVRDGSLPSMRLGRRVYVVRAKLLADLGLSADELGGTDEGALPDGHHLN
jgi:excisionase family DNA binding protein